MKMKPLLSLLLPICLNVSVAGAAEDSLPVWGKQLLEELAVQGTVEGAASGSYLTADLSRREGAKF